MPGPTDSASPPSDRELLARYIQGDVSAFESLLDRYERTLLVYAARHLGRGGEDGARDIVQEAFVKLIARCQELRSQESLAPWLYRVTRNLAIDRKRKDDRMEKYHRLAATREQVAPPPSQAEREEAVQMVERKLHELPPNQRDVLILKIQEGRSYKEISAITGLTPSNIGYLIHHGLKRLAGDLRRAGAV